MKNLDRFIKNSQGIKVEKKTTSINIEKSQWDFLKKKNLNLSMLIRDMLEKLMKEEETDL